MRPAIADASGNHRDLRKDVLRTLFRTAVEIYLSEWKDWYDGNAAVVLSTNLKAGSITSAMEEMT